MTSATAARWGQTKAPSHAFALFTPDRVPATTPTTTDLEYASLWYTDDAGAVTNTAVHGNIEADRSGTGDWLVDTIWYDEQGNVSQTLDAAGRARVLASDPADQAATAEQQSAFTHYSPDGRRVEDEYGPVHTATLTDGTVGPLRSHTQYVYDDEDPNLGGGSKPALPEGSTAFDLVVETRHSATGPDMVGTFDTIVSRNEYAPVVPGDGNGWLLGAPTVERVQLADGSWSSTITRSDATGRTIETRQPGGATNADGSGSDGRSTILSYYEKNSADPDCSTTLETHTERIGWIGLLCKSSPAGQPTAPSIPLVYYAGFDDRLKPTRVEQRSGSTTRVTTTAYDALERPVTTTVTDGSDTRTTTRTYDATNGLPTGQNAGPKSLTATYDSWGRAWTYTDAWGMRSETSYTPSGEIAAFDDGSGTTTYTYDTAPGEHRRFPGIVKVGLTTGQPDEFLLSYDARGAAQEITYPNGLVAAHGYDEIGDPTSLVYGDSTGQPLLSFTSVVDADSRIVGAGSATVTRQYGFDKLGSLTQTKDYAAAGCTVRTYGFNAALQRTSWNSYAPDANGACQLTTPSVTKAGTYDSADRIRNTGYTYDDLGRTLTIPAADTAPGGSGPLTATGLPLVAWRHRL